MDSEIFCPENWFLIFLAVFWILIAIIQDFRKREVANWWNFSLIAIALAYRAFASATGRGPMYLAWGFIGLAAGYCLANIFYYSRVFAGGDAKLLFALGAVLPMAYSWQANLRIFSWFFVLFLVSGAVYGLFYSTILAVKARKKISGEFSRVFNKHKKIAVITCALSAVLAIASFATGAMPLFWLFSLLFASPFLLVYAKSVENACMIKKVSAADLTIGDWLEKDINVGGRIIKARWQGLDEKELRIIRKKHRKKILVKYGVPFTPAFLSAFLLMLLVFWLELGWQVLISIN